MALIDRTLKTVFETFESPQLLINMASNSVFVYKPPNLYDVLLVVNTKSKSFVSFFLFTHFLVISQSFIFITRPSQALHWLALNNVSDETL